MVALLNLHCIAESAGRSRNNGYLLNGSGLRLHCRNKRVADFMIRHDLLFVVRSI